MVAVGMMLPNELIWIMDKMGLEWPDIDEDEVRKAASLVRGYRGDMETLVQAADRRINGEIATAMRGQTGTAHVTAWNRNRSENVQQLLDVLDPAASGIDIAADVVLALKIKVIAEVTLTLIQLVPLLAAGPFGAGGAAVLILVRKKLFSMMMEITLEQVINEVLPLVLEPLAEQVPGLVMAMLDSPVVEGAIGDVDEMYADLEALDQAAEDMDAHATDVEELTDRLLADLANLQISGD
ncbi:hypothetical protein MAE01_06810 [Microbacterium aerolatum]|uniref:Outer membrane channel protein CpnT-like N-terminal domain-containing protein n=2 Tax=Microbacterium aerolatum TaxID=153731 RepID=A0A511ABH1_9MICO|nr:hypothetical protein MAE01_06810 [Microbacterium aerolatum]